MLSESAEQTNSTSSVERQSVWGSLIPTEILYRIFQLALEGGDCLPTICNLGKVCLLWNDVSSTPSLWHTVDLGMWTRKKCRTDKTLHRIIESRLSKCKEFKLTATDWKIKDVANTLIVLHRSCENLVGIGLSGWKTLKVEHLKFIVEHFRCLRKLDLSSINIEAKPIRSAISAQPLCNAIQSIASRLTHLNLSNNQINWIPQIVSALSTHCPNLELLDLSLVRVDNSRYPIFHIEELQANCQNLKILRLANSCFTFNTIDLEKQMNSPGFPHLEQLSVAAMSHVNDEILIFILKSSTKLKLLDNLEYLFLSGSTITKDSIFSSFRHHGLELILSKYSHCIKSLDVAWTNLDEALNNSLRKIAQEQSKDDSLRNLDLRGSSVSLEAVKEILKNCRHLENINLESCRGLPRGLKRVFDGYKHINELRLNLGIGAERLKRKFSD